MSYPLDRVPHGRYPDPVRVFFFVSFLVVSVGLGLELAVRLVIPQSLIREPPDLWRRDPEIGWRHPPNARVQVNAAGRDVWICTDAVGDRVDCDAQGPRDCARRILVIGDSFVEALAVPFRETVWSRLERDTGACADVAGVGSYEMGQYLMTARKRLVDPARHYDLVILNFYAGNDFTRDATNIPSAFGVELAHAATLSRQSVSPGVSGWSRHVASLKIWLGAHSHAYVAALVAKRRIESLSKTYFGWGSRALRRSKLRKKFVLESARGIQMIAAEAERAGSRLLVVVIPHWSQVLDPRGARLVKLFPRFADDVDMDIVSKRFVPHVRRIPNIETVDLLPYLRKHATPEDWALDFHFSSTGHELWFEAIRDPVRAMLPAGATIRPLPH
jgi:hypothetical protein